MLVLHVYRRRCTIPILLISAQILSSISFIVNQPDGPIGVLRYVGAVSWHVVGHCVWLAIRRIFTGRSLICRTFREGVFLLQRLCDSLQGSCTMQNDKRQMAWLLGLQK